MDSEEVPPRSRPSSFELLITCNPPILQSLLAQVPTDTIFRLYQTSYCLRDFLTKSPTSWRYISWRLYQPTISNAIAPANGAIGPRQSSNYALDQILLNIINPFSTRLVSLELDNTAVSGATLTSTVLILRRDTLRHVSVRGCKNVSLKYHINPWLQMHALARESQSARGPTGFETLALESLYTYRCRHHRRRPYLPSSLSRKESDSEPTHELVNTCHKLGIWTDTAWCTTPGARCFRRRGYVKMRMPQGTREVWVVYDRLWRSRNWLGPIDSSRSTGSAQPKKRRMDGRSWEFDEEGVNGEAIGVNREGKATPAHLRQTHKAFVEDIVCHNCSVEILERCEQCSVMMHCTGCRKTLCASCAFDRPYLRNKNAPEEERNKYWWAPGYAVSPCTMQDQDQPANAAIGAQNADPNMLPNIKFRWCCTEPVFSGGGGITFGNTNSRETDKIRAAPLPIGKGWEDPEFGPERPDVEDELVQQGPGGRWPSIDSFFKTAEALGSNEPPSFSIPRVLCDECYSAEHWRLKCKACATALCLKHDIGDRMKTRICGYRDVVVERQDFKSRQKALKLLATLVRHRKERLAAEKPATEQDQASSSLKGPSSSRLTPTPQRPSTSESLTYGTEREEAVDTPVVGLEQTLRAHRAPLAELDPTHRPLSPASTSTGPLSRSTSPTPSFHSTPATPEPSANPLHSGEDEASALPLWQGCQAFFCPATRSPGDHRRRCPAIMKQCFECRVNICGDCVSTLEPPCPCKGCRAHQTEEQVSSPDPAPLFFCPNCRWGRMESGKCKRRSEAFLIAQSSSRKMKKRRDRIRKPVEERRLGGPTSLASTEEAIDGLVDFFTSLHTTPNRTNSPQPPPGESRPSASNQQNPPPAANRPASMQALLTSLPMPTGIPMGTLHAQHHHHHHHHHRHILPPHLNEFQELEDMGLLARDLIRRIQRLRDQYRPGSLAAIALPDVRVHHNGNNAAGPAVAQAPPRPLANPQPRPQQQNGIAVAGPADPVQMGNNQEIDDRESGTDEEEED
ncbi:hypothetical protein H2204_006653 [Knufia peltigerae]|uniref:Uncharacterized protein n=1 Tax=Knufia peltigerae TaxID=1002370 RepID=A0AA38Y3H1_9EURO|nr:hypothetical protein H2204_006653 [Knufia peltigerae]